MKFSTKYIDTRVVRYFLVAIAATFCVSGHAQTPAVNVSTVLADSFASYVVKSDHSLWMWGQCGTFYGGTPTQYSIAVNQVSCGSDSIYGGHMIFTDAGNNLFGIGSNSGAGLNVLSNTASNSSGFTPIGSDFVQISTSNSHSLGIKSNGTLWAWGTNGAGQLGDGSTTGRAQPVLIGSGYASVYTGDYYTLALKTDGSMWGWGFNSSGQLGDGTTVAKNSPVQVLTGVSSVATRNGTSLAVKTDGTLWSWGINDSGQLGDGTTADKLTPVNVGSGYSKVATGGHHALALKASNGSLYAWGGNDFGQLGNASRVSTGVQTLIGSGYGSIAAGEYHSIALKNDGSVWTWGRNMLGQLGNGVVGDQFFSTVPVNVDLSNVVSTTYAVSGVVSGLATGKTITLLNNGTDSLILNGNGAFSFSTRKAAGSNYTVTIETQPTGQTCTISNGSGTSASANITNINIACSGSVLTLVQDFTNVAIGAQWTPSSCGPVVRPSCYRAYGYDNFVPWNPSNGNLIQVDVSLAVTGSKVNSNESLYVGNSLLTDKVNFGANYFWVGDENIAAGVSNINSTTTQSYTTPEELANWISYQYGPDSGGSAMHGWDSITNYGHSLIINTKVTFTYTVGKGNQSIIFGTEPVLTFGGTDTVIATATSGLPVTFTSTTTGVCTVSGSTVRAIATGTCTVAANQAGDSNYDAAIQVTQNITVGQGTQTITFGAAPSLATGGTGAASASATSGLAVAFTSTTPAICTVSGNMVSGVSAGTCTIAANQAGNTNYAAAAQATQSIVVSNTAPVANAGVAQYVAIGAMVGLDGTGSSDANGDALSYSWSLTSKPNGSTAVLSLPNTAKPTFTADKSGTYVATLVVNDGKVSSPSVTVTITAGLNFGVVSGIHLNLLYPVTTSGGKVYYILDANGDGQINGDDHVSHITMNQIMNSGSDTFNTQSTGAVAGIDDARTTVIDGYTLVFPTTDEIIALRTELNHVPPSNWLGCTDPVTGNTFCFNYASATRVSVGVHNNVSFVYDTIFTNLYDGYYQGIVILEVIPNSALSNQSISFGDAPTLTFGGTVTVIATATSGLPVTFTSTTSGVCTVSGSTVRAIATGTCTVAANQAGDSSYGAATQVTQSITVAQALPVMLLSPSMLTFGSQILLSTSAAQSIMLSNTGAGTLNIASIAPSGDYARTTTCGSTLAAGANCSINVTFTPTATGTRTGTITISSDASGSPHSAALSGVALASGSVNMSSGWNLIGNGQETSLDVSTVFADSTKITTVWKWVITGSTAGIAYPAWAFYTPALADGGQAYAASKGYDYLSTINAGEGFWVNAKTAFAVAIPTGTAVQSTSFMPALPGLGMPGGTHALAHSWSLIATGDNPTPTQFDAAISTFEAVPPAAGSSNVYTNLTTLWAWDAANTSWYFWAPALVNNGGLAAYLTSKGYLDFATLPSTPAGRLSPATGVWVNMP